MSDFAAQLSHLIAYQGLLLQQDALARRQAEVPERRARADEQVAAAEQRGAEARDALLRHEQGVRAAEGEIRTREERLRKGRAAMATIKDNETFKKSQAELKQIEADIDAAENRVLAALEESEPLRRRRQEADAALADRRAARAALDGELAAAEERLGAEQAALAPVVAAQAARLDEDLRVDFERRRPAHRGRALVFAEGAGRTYSCGACSVELTVQEVSQLLIRKTLITCQNCGAMLAIDRELHDFHGRRDDR